MFRHISMVLRNLRARPLRTLLTMSGIVLGVAVILAISITNRSTIDSVSSVFGEASGKAQLVVTSSTLDGEGFSEHIRSRIATVPGVKVAIPTLQVQTPLAGDAASDEPGISFFGSVYGGLTVYGIEPALDPQAREYKMVEGEFLSGDLDAYDIVLVSDYADEEKIELGQDVDLLTPHGRETLRVVGLMSKEGPGQLYNGAFGVIPLEAAQEIFDRAGDLDQIDIIATPDAASGIGLESLKVALQTRLGEDYTVTFPATQGERVTQMLSGYQMGLNFFSVIALFVGAYLIYNAFSMTVVERTREIGMLRTVGMTRRQVMVQVLIEAAVLGIAGAVLGVGAGILISQGLIRAMEALIAQEVRGVQVPLDGLAISLLAGLGVTLAAAAIPAWQASRVSPLEALRIRGKPGEGWLIRKGWISGLALMSVALFLLLVNPFPAEIQAQVAGVPVFALFVGATLLVPSTIGGWVHGTRRAARLVYGAEGQLGSSNVQRARLRTTLTVATLMIGVAMILSIEAMTKGFESDILGWMDKYIGGDLYIYSSVPLRADLDRRLEGVEGVEAVTPMRNIDVKWLKPDGDEERLVFSAVDPASYRRVTSFVFTSNPEDPELLMDRLADGDAVFVSTVLSEKYGLQPGDTMLLKTRRGQRLFDVLAIVVDYNNQGVVVSGSAKDVRRYFGLRDVDVFLLKVQPGHSQQEVQERIDRQFGKRHHLTIVSNQAFKGRAIALLNQTLGLFDVLAMIAMVVAGLGVVNTLTMNVLERTRELGMLRSLGMTRWQMGRMILAEAGMMGLMGGAFGLLFGLVLPRVFLTAINAVQGYRLPYILPTWGIVVSLAIALVVSQLAAVWPGWRAARLHIIEAIQFE